MLLLTSLPDIVTVIARRDEYRTTETSNTVLHSDCTPKINIVRFDRRPWYTTTSVVVVVVVVVVVAEIGRYDVHPRCWATLDCNRTQLMMVNGESVRRYC